MTRGKDENVCKYTYLPVMTGGKDEGVYKYT